MATTNKNKEIKSDKDMVYDIPLCDITENENEYKISFELPGIEKEDINIKIDKDILTVEAKSNKEPENTYNCLLSEMSFDNYKRAFNLNKSVDTEKINADYKNGVLSLTLPKREEQKTKEIDIKIS